MSNEWQPMETAPKQGQIVQLNYPEAFTKDGRSIGRMFSAFARWLPWGNGMAWVSKKIEPYGNLEFKDSKGWKRGAQGRGKYADWGEANPSQSA